MSDRSRPKPNFTPSDEARPSNRLDLLIPPLIVIGWETFAWFATHGLPALMYDSFRDMGYAENILHGRFWQDPALAGYSWWYPPGNPLFFAALARLTGRSVLELYVSSVYWLNVLSPLLLYLLVRSALRSRAAGLIALGMTMPGSWWWLTHAAAPMPSAQGVALNLAALWVWNRAQSARWTWSVATGGLMALSIWHHALCGMVLTGAVVLHGALAALAPPVSRTGAEGSGAAPRLAVAWRAALASGLALALAAPLLAHLLFVPKRNAAPFRWFAPELHDPRFALHAHAPLVVPLGLIGAWVLIRARHSMRWAVGYLLVGLAGELAGYVGHDLIPGLPFTLPHEFQWHEHLALAVCAAAGTMWIADRLAARGRATARRARRALALAGITALTLGPTLGDLGMADYELMRLDQSWQGTIHVCGWIRKNVPIDATIACHPDPGYFLSGLTGRKVVALPAGHMNPASDARQRYADLGIMLSTTDPAAFTRAAARYDVRYLMVVPPQERMAGLRALYSNWPDLAAIDLGEVNVLLYRVASRLQTVP